MRYPTTLLLLGSALALAACSASTDYRPTTFAPPAAEMRREMEPAKPADFATSEAAYDGWNQSVLDWGRRGWATVARLCAWHQQNDPDIPLDCLGAR